MSWLVGIASHIPQTLQKRIAKFVVKRALGQFLLHDLVLDQLDVSLALGTLELKNLALNDHMLNELLHDVPITVVRGTVGTVALSIPWTSLGVDKCIVELSDIEVVMVPDAVWQSSNKASSNADDLLSTSMHLAQEFLYKGSPASPSNRRGAKLSAADMSKSMIFEKTSSAQSTATGAEMDGLNVLAGLIERILETLVVTTRNTVFRMLFPCETSKSITSEFSYAVIDLFIPTLQISDNNAKRNTEGAPDLTNGLHKMLKFNEVVIRLKRFTSTAPISKVADALPAPSISDSVLAVVGEDDDSDVNKNDTVYGCFVQLSKSITTSDESKLAFAVHGHIPHFLAVITPIHYEILQQLLSYLNYNTTSTTGGRDTESIFSSDSESTSASSSSSSPLDKVSNEQLHRLLADSAALKPSSSTQKSFNESSMMFYSTVASFDTDVTAQFSLAISHLNLCILPTSLNINIPSDLGGLKYAAKYLSSIASHFSLSVLDLSIVQQIHTPNTIPSRTTSTCSVNMIRVYEHSCSLSRILAVLDGSDSKLTSTLTNLVESNASIQELKREWQQLSDFCIKSNHLQDYRKVIDVQCSWSLLDHDDEDDINEGRSYKVECIADVQPLHIWINSSSVALLVHIFRCFQANQITTSLSTSPTNYNFPHILTHILSIIVWCDSSESDNSLFLLRLLDIKLESLSEDSLLIGDFQNNAQVQIGLEMTASSVDCVLRTAGEIGEIARLFGNELLPVVSMQILATSGPTVADSLSNPRTVSGKPEASTFAEYQERQRQFQSFLHTLSDFSKFRLTFIVPVFMAKVSKRQMAELMRLQAGLNNALNSTDKDDSRAPSTVTSVSGVKVDKFQLTLRSEGLDELSIRGEKASAQVVLRPSTDKYGGTFAVMNVGSISALDNHSKEAFVTTVPSLSLAGENSIVMIFQPSTSNGHIRVHTTIQHLSLLLEQDPKWNSLLTRFFDTDENTKSSDIRVSLSVRDCCIQPVLKPCSPAAVLHVMEVQVNGAISTVASSSYLNVLGSSNLFIRKNDGQATHKTTNSSNTLKYDTLARLTMQEFVLVSTCETLDLRWTWSLLDTYHEVHILNQRILLNTCADSYPLLTSLSSALTGNSSTETKKESKAPVVLEPVDLSQSRMLGLSLLDEDAFVNRQPLKYFDLNDLTLSLVEDFDPLIDDLDLPKSPSVDSLDTPFDESIQLADVTGLEIVDGHFAGPKSHSRTPSSHRASMVRVRCKNVSVTWKLFDGLDWASSFQQGRSSESQIDFLFTNVKVEYDLFEETSETASSLTMSLQNFEIIDNIDSSTWKKFLSPSRRDYQSSLPVMRITAVGIRVPNNTTIEYRLKVQVQPLKLNIDQETLDTLVNFFTTPTETQDGSKSDIFIQRCEVYPIMLRIDYKPKHVDYKQLKQGNFVEMLNFFNLEGAELNLRHLIVTGVRGWSQLLESILEGWTPHVTNTQVQNIVSGVGPIRSFRNIASGVADLVLLPVQQYKKDGRIIKGLRQGARNLVSTAAVEALNLGTKLAVGTHGVLEQADNLLSHNTTNVNKEAGGSLHPISVSRYADQPANIKEGLELAYKSLAHNVSETAKIIAMPMEVFERDGSGNGMRAVIKAVPIAILRPVIGATEAVSKTLMGMRNAMDPSMKHESEDVR